MNVSDFRRILRLEGVDAVEGKWLELLESGDIEVGPALSMIDVLVGEGQKDRARDMLDMLCEELLKRRLYGPALTALKRSFDLFGETQRLRDQFVTCYRALYTDSHPIEDIIDETGIRARSPLGEALARVDLFLFFTPGEPVRHRSWGAGRISEVDIRGASVVVDFLDKPGHRLDLKLAQTALTKLAPESFEGRLVTDPEGIAALARDDPAAVVRLLLETVPEGLTTKDVRKRLEGTAVAADEWSKWWTRARKAVYSDPFIEVGPGNAPLLKLRAEAFDPLAECLRLVEETTNARTLLAELPPLLKRVTRPKEHAEALGRLASFVARSAAETGSQPMRWALVRLLDTIAKLAPDVRPARPDVVLPSTPEELGQWLGALPARDERLDLLAACVAAKGERASEFLADAILKWEADVGDHAVSELARLAPDRLETVLLEVFSRSETHFDAFVALVRPVLAGRLRFPEALSPADIYRSLAMGTNRLQSGVIPTRGRPEDVYKAARSVLVDQKIVEQVLKETPKAEVRRLYALVESLRRLDPRPLQILEASIGHTHPDIFAPQAATGAPDESVIFTTRAGLERLRRQYDELVHEELPKVADALGHAISLGDISDNAEYRSARQRQQDLVARVKRMREELGRAQVRTAADVKLDRVGFGVAVGVTSAATGARSTFQILGPWDVNVEEGIISYMSPLGRGFWGALPGTEVTIKLPDSTTVYRIDQLSLSPVLAAEAAAPAEE